MKNNKWILSALLLSSTVALGNGGEPVYIPAPLSGFYIGADISGDFARAKGFQTADWEQCGGCFPHTFGNNWNISLNGWNAEALVGYGFDIARSHFSLGIEAFAAMSSAKGDEFLFAAIDAAQALPNLGAESFSSHISVKNIYGARALLGFTIAPRTMLFGLLGWANVGINVDQDSFVRLTLADDTTIRNFLPVEAPNFSKRKSTAVIGGGIETRLAPQLGLRVMYQYMPVGKINHFQVGPKGFNIGFLIPPPTVDVPTGDVPAGDAPTVDVATVADSNVVVDPTSTLEHNRLHFNTHLQQISIGLTVYF